MSELHIGDRVTLLTCSDGKPGTVQEVKPGRVSKVAVIFDDLPAVRWVLKTSSLQRVKSAKAKEVEC